MKNILLVGAGTMGKAHADAYQVMPDVHITGIVDSDEEKAKSLANKFETQYFPNLNEALQENENIQIVDVCLPTNHHFQAVSEATKHCKAIICEKPLSRTLTEAEKMIQLCNNNNSTLYVGHVLRFFHEFASIKQQIERNMIGEPKMVRSLRGGSFPRGYNDWYSNSEQSGGLILDMIIHDFDFLRWCFGEVERVYARSLSEDITNKIDYALVTLRFANGMIAHVEGTWAHEGFSSAMEISGTDGIIDYDSSIDQSIHLQPRVKNNVFSGVAVPSSPLNESPYYRQLRHFIDCENNKHTPIVTAKDAYEAMRIALAAIELAKTKEPVTLNHN
ncbi:Gfo/Idh/MocA family oxidoreductase [Bacillus shivajii]|uniref:Gfo/Idh/MocA family protein n=1 Tax=Bacillus shivajii TaxID=1983719 RepID=UPI001CF97E0F|nr:Gfo/Idh/MocA family oxidoreductase [Bacillus shivajii]UCZ52807.1 Gfo/Idh/MocA family oxidoreductase [Bacillus shivajii]